MALQFPSNPTLNQTYSSGSSATYTWNGSFWQTTLPPTQTVLTATSASFATSASAAISSVTATSASFATTASLSTSATRAVSAATASYYKTMYANLGLAGNLVGYGLNSEITWSSATASSEITVSNANITLPAGTWMVNADINCFNFSDTTNGYINVNLMNSSNVAITGTSQANPGPLSANYNYSSTGKIIGIFTLTAPTVVKFRLPAAQGTATVGAANTRAIITSINI